MTTLIFNTSPECDAIRERRFNKPDARTKTITVEGPVRLAGRCLVNKDGGTIAYFEDSEEMWYDTSDDDIPWAEVLIGPKNTEFLPGEKRYVHYDHGTTELVTVIQVDEDGDVEVVSCFGSTMYHAPEKFLPRGATISG